MFYKKPANNLSIRRRKPVFGVGVNDSEYMVSVSVNGNVYHCEEYLAWVMMLRRSYDPYYANKNPTYINVTVDDRWLMFSEFSSWHSKNKVKGYDLDKDIKIKDNITYSPDSCLFIPQSLNKLFTDRINHRGNFPLGVNFNKNNNTYIARVCFNGKRIHVGSFKSPEEASMAYKVAKNKVIEQAMIDHPKFAKYLPQHMYKI